MNEFLLSLLMLLSMLSAPNWRHREAAQKALAPLTPLLLPVLENLEKTGDAEMSRRCERLLKRHYSDHADALSKQMDLPPIDCYPAVNWTHYELIDAYLDAAYQSLGRDRHWECRPKWIGCDENMWWHGEGVKREATRLLVRGLIAARQNPEPILKAMRAEQKKKTDFQ